MYLVSAPSLAFSASCDPPADRILRLQALHDDDLQPTGTRSSIRLSV
jgi:hypothetical protein